MSPNTAWLRGPARLVGWLTGWSRRAKRLLMVATDVLLIPSALWCAVALKFDTWPAGDLQVIALSLVALLFAMGAFLAAGLYHSVVRFLGSSASYAIVAGVLLSAVATVVYDAFFPASSALPWSVFVTYAALAMLFVGGSRLLARHLLNAFPDDDAAPLIIYGAGASGRQIATALHGSREHRPIAFIDDQRSMQGAVINSLPVVAPAALPALVRKWKGVSVLLAMPSASRKRRQEILASLLPLGVHVKSLPDMSEILSGQARPEDIRELDVADILGRGAVSPNDALFAVCLRNKSVMVTGAGGSIGSELCRQILRNNPRRLVLFEISEIALYNLERELSTINGSEGLGVEIVPLLGDAKRRDRILPAMRAYGVQTVYHAAAYKHVPIVENNAVEGVRNNTFSTWVAAEAAIDAEVEAFVLVSTDKAVNPTNVMGATKRAAEMVLQAMQGRGSKTRFAMVRFGNVLASSGSVVPLFQEQIRKGGPVTVTHPDVIRYFMTIPEAAQLVIQAGAMGQGGDVFVLDMGQPVRIVDLARRMIGLAGRTVRDATNPNGDLEIQFTGLRPGEKLYEELLIGNDVSGTEHPMIMRAIEHHLSWEQLEPLLRQLDATARNGDCAGLLATLKNLVVEYVPAASAHDLIWQALGRPVSTTIVADAGDNKVALLSPRRPRVGGGLDQTIP
jgi:FlaA1/EpsC-like NDP-sugar epimerase